jgi:hypothetical protein
MIEEIGQGKYHRKNHIPLSCCFSIMGPSDDKCESVFDFFGIPSNAFEKIIARA